MVVHVLIKSFSFFNENSPFKQSCSLTVSWQHQCLAIERGKLIKSGVFHTRSCWNAPPSVWSAKPITTKSCVLEKTKTVEDGKKQSFSVVKADSLFPHPLDPSTLLRVSVTSGSLALVSLHSLSHQERAVHAAPSCHANYSKGIMTLTPFQCSLGL